MQEGTEMDLTNYVQVNNLFVAEGFVTFAD